MLTWHPIAIFPRCFLLHLRHDLQMESDRFSTSPFIPLCFVEFCESLSINVWWKIACGRHFSEERYSSCKKYSSRAQGVLSICATLFERTFSERWRPCRTHSYVFINVRRRERLSAAYSNFKFVTTNNHWYVTDHLASVYFVTVHRWNIYNDEVQCGHVTFKFCNVEGSF